MFKKLKKNYPSINIFIFFIQLNNCQVYFILLFEKKINVYLFIVKNKVSVREHVFITIYIF